MRSPFPGMDPFLERQPRWQVFHGWLIRELARQVAPKAREVGCWVDVERSVYLQEPSGEVMLLGEPDLLAGPDPVDSSRERRWATNGAVAMVEPQAVHEVVLEPDERFTHKQDYLVVRDEFDGMTRVLAVVELLSFANKEGSYVPKYREKRSLFIASRAHFLEIDFLRAGENPSRGLFPELSASPYFIYLARKTGVGRNEEGYPVRLQESLPTIGLPLTPNRPVLPLNLQAAFESAYDLSLRPALMRYDFVELPGPKLTAADQEWVRQLIETSRNTGEERS